MPTRERRSYDNEARSVRYSQRNRTYLTYLEARETSLQI